MIDPGMAPIEDRKEEAARWLAIAMEDIRVSRACLDLFEPALGAAAYHCQQAAEKLLKALLIVAGVRPPRTHDLAELGRSAEPFFELGHDLIDRLVPLTEWSTTYRYPSDDPFSVVPPDPAVILTALVDVSRLADQLQNLTSKA